MPLHACEKVDKGPSLPIKGIGGDTCTVGSTTFVLDLDIEDNPPHTFLVADTDMEFMIMGLDFMKKRRLCVLPHLSALVQVGTWKGIPLTYGRDLGPDTFWQKFLNDSEIDKRLDDIKLSEIFSIDTDRDQPPNPGTAENRCLEILRCYPELIKEPDYTTPPKHSHVLDIEVSPEFKPAKFRNRPCSVKSQQIIDENFEILIKKGAATRGTAKMTSPVTIVYKKNGKPRVCVDYTHLNKFTITQSYPLPLIQHLTQRLNKKHCIFSAIDLTQAYLCLPLTPRATQLAAITTQNGVYLPLRCTFGLVGAPFKFCELIAELTLGMETFVFAYLDDFLVFSESPEQHYDHLKRLFERLDLYGMFVNESKCHFAKSCLHYLGHEVSNQGLRPLADKVAAISRMQPPTTLTELRRFLGCLNYYRVFIPKLSEIVSPLTDLLKGPPRKKSSKLNWSTTQQKAYEGAIQALINATHLSYEEPDLPLILSTDASISHVGAALEQPCSSANEVDLKPLSFFSKALPPTATVRSVFNRELTALYFAIRYYKHRILGKRLIVRTDHKSLVKAVNNGIGEHSVREARMISYIKEYCPEMRFLSGEENVVADWLSRPNKDPATTPLTKATEGTNLVATEINEQRGQVTHYKNQAPEVSTTDPTIFSLSIDEDEDDTPLIEYVNLSMNLIAQFQEKEPELIEEVRNLSILPKSNFRLERRPIPTNPERHIHGIVPVELDTFRIIAPTDLRTRIFNLFHATIHQGTQKSTDIVGAHYFWPGLTKDVSEWVKACPKCQSCKITRHNRQRLQNYPGNPARLHSIHIDLVGPLEESDGCRYILTARDRGSGLISTAAIPDKTSKSVIEALTEHYISHYGVPAVVISDNGREFTSNEFGDFCKTVGIHHKRTTAYHPQSNGHIERIHRTMKVAFRALEDSSTWKCHLPWIKLMMNNLICDINSYSSFQQTFGQSAKLPGTIMFQNEITPDFTLNNLHTQAFFELMNQHQRRGRTLPDNSPYIEKDLFSCEKVWVRSDGPKPNLAPLYGGPHMVILRQEKFFTIAMGSRHVNVSVDRLKVYHKLPSANSPQEPGEPPDESDELNEEPDLDNQFPDGSNTYNFRPRKHRVWFDSDSDE